VGRVYFCFSSLRIIFGLLLSITLTVLSADEHVCGPMTIGVEVDSQSFMTVRDYQIDIAIDGLTVSRLNAPLVGDTLVSYAADLLGDSFCDVVVVSEGGSGQEIYLDVYEWAEHRLQPVKLTALPSKSSLGKEAASTVSVVDNRLIFLTQPHLTLPDTTQAVVKLFYSFEASEWVER
jgi:hypothetical protein